MTAGNRRRLRPSTALSAALVLALVAAVIAVPGRPAEVELVTTDAAERIGSAVPGSHLRLGAGEHRGPIVVDRPLRLSAEPGARITAPAGAVALLVTQTADVDLVGLDITGGSNAIEIRDSDDISVDRVRIRGSELHGIFVHDAEVSVEDCHISGLRSDLAQGFEIINSDTRGASSVRGCTVEGPVFEGISSHVSHVTFSENTVTRSTQRGIVITEMSMGTALRNHVSGAAGSAYFCGDMSRCTFLDNVASDVRPSAAGWRSSAGHGLVVHFHSTATIKRLRASDVTGESVLLILDSHRQRHPSSGLPPLAPILGVAALYALLLALARATGLRGAQAVLLPTLALQLGHQLEHAVQVGQVILGSASTHGLAGAVLDNEWLHLAFNAALMGGIVVTARRARPSLLLLAAVAVQGYHVVEHVVRVGQYLVTGITPAAGLAGAVVGTGAGLVWFHFFVNLAVTAMLAAAALATPVVREGRKRWAGVAPAALAGQPTR